MILLQTRISGMILLLIAAFLPATVFGQNILSGQVTGLIKGSQLVLQMKDGDDIKINLNGPFKIPMKLANGSDFQITIKEQPANLRCIITNGSGTFTGKNSNIAITCPMAYLNSVTWMRCTHGQKWSNARANCSDAGKANSFGAVQLRFCPVNDNSCNGGSSNGKLSSGEVFDACDSLNSGEGTYGITTWRVPLIEELKSIVICTDGTATPLNDYGTDPYKCGYKNKNYSNGTWKSPALDNDLFPNSMSLEYWSASPHGKNVSSAWSTAFQNGWSSTSSKSNHSYVRCVAD